jgi:hypothetical protein
MYFSRNHDNGFSFVADDDAADDDAADPCIIKICVIIKSERVNPCINRAMVVENDVLRDIYYFIFNSIYVILSKSIWCDMRFRNFVSYCPVMGLLRLLPMLAYEEPTDPSNGLNTGHKIRVSHQHPRQVLKSTPGASV